MKIFVLGRSKSGKSPFADAVASKLGLQHIKASQWVRQQFVAPAGVSSTPEFIDAITAFSLLRLRENPRACVEFIRTKYDLNQPSVIDGIRSLHDFVQLFDPASDRVVFLERKDNELKPTKFEEGLQLISTYVNQLVELQLLDSSRVDRYEYRRFDESPDDNPCSLRILPALTHVIDRFLARLPPKTVSTPAAVVQANVHADIPGFRLFVRTEFLYDMDPAFKGHLTPGFAFAFSSYPGEVPTFKVLLDGGSVFSYLPLHALQLSAIAQEPHLGLAELAYHTCAQGKIAVCKFAELAKEPCSCYFAKRNLWLSSTYLFTVDWYEGNDLLHCLSLANGQLAMLPNHKVKFANGPRHFEPYRKLHSKWTRNT
ncbi:MAG: hypothetical protein K2W95_35840 [Candidatus Obscuribacterales bacterium]|nr:hypothetical protein [Candidatus Obscuribacterales bacterium]